MVFHINSFYRKVAVLLLFTISIELLFPVAAFALTGGPGQPEFSSFSSVGTTNMVNEFTGDFTYNLPVIHVPGPHGSGYALSLAYQSGASLDEEASWVGHGWTLSPGAINRNTRGLPDDYKGEVTYWNKMDKNWTAAVELGAGLEALSYDKLPFLNGKIKTSTTFSYNNNLGFGLSKGMGLNIGLFNTVNLGANVRDGDVGYTASFSPAYILFKDHLLSRAQKGKPANNQLNASLYAMKARMGGISHSFAESVKPSGIQEYTGKTYSVSTNIMFAPVPFPGGPTVNVNGSYSFQKAKESQTKKAYGYMYAGNIGESTDDRGVQDYYVEKDTPYQKRDVNIGIPFNNADNFFVSGEGIGGGFRLHHKQLGEFYPTAAESRMTSYFGGLEVNVGGALGTGVDIVKGHHTLSIGKWLQQPKKFSTLGDEEEDEPVFFRFNNDLGGSWKADKKRRGNVLLTKSGGRVPGSYSYSPVVQTSHLEANEHLRSGRASYIGFNTNREMTSNSTGVTSFKSYTKRADIEFITDRKAAPDAIGEFAITTETGQKYLYGLPLYNRNETSLMFGVSGATTTSNHLVYHNKEEVKVGQEINDKPFASTFLLTQLTTPDYVDRTLDGPTEDDFGGYTVFHYEKLYGYKPGGSGDWYRWRVPYTGLLYQKNSLSDPRDDMGSVTEGEKEIALLKYIKTKTHVAFFVTSERQDGIEAAGKDAKTNPTAKGSKKLKKLDRIELYLLSDVASVNGSLTDADGRPLIKEGKKPIKTVRFEYNGYTYNGRTVSGPQAWHGIPNGEGVETGKLTLSKIWFEYNGIEGGKISPYKFEYVSPDPAAYPAVYASAGIGSHKQGLQEMPAYNALNLDAWGNYQEGGSTRYLRHQAWLNQKPAPTFDPAAWQLKVIKLPSGGEIHVQYEQDDYAYVQDKAAHVMVNLSEPAPGATGCLPTSTRRYQVNLSQTEAQPEEVQKLIRQLYINGKQKMYFKFLYNLRGNEVPGLTTCSADYITGYAELKDAIVCNGNLYIELEDDIPQTICKEFAKNQLTRIMRSDGTCDPATKIDDRRGAVDVVKQLANRALDQSLIGLLTSDNICQKMNYAESYFKIPYPGNKKGGGIRVKRLLTFDRGFDGQAVLYGNEYHYDVFDKLVGKVRSSGVALNEPTAIREENGMVENLPRKVQGKVSKMLAGEDLTIAEEPLGETVMPAPSVGYSHVTIRNIHSGKTGTGYTIKEFLTAKDSPVVTDVSPLDTRRDQLPTIGLGVYSTTVDNVWATQNFIVHLNNMHGQISRVASYAGAYDRNLANGGGGLTSEQLFEYYKPGESIPTLSEYGGLIESSHLGEEVDITLAHRAVTDRYTSTSLESDFNALLSLLPVPSITAFLSVASYESELYTYATSKVVRYPVILKKVTSTADGITTDVEHLAFDRNTGVPVISKTTDNIKGTYTGWESMAAWLYPELSGKWQTERAVFNNLAGVTLQGSAQAGWLLDFGAVTASACHPVLSKLGAGDLLLLNGSLIGHIDAPNTANNTVKIYKATAMAALSNVFPNNQTSAITRIEVLRSGKFNRLLEKSGNTVLHAGTGTAAIPQLSRLDRMRENGEFEQDLTNALRNTGTVITLAKTYHGINLSAFTEQLDDAIKDKASSLSIRDVKFIRRQGVNQSYKLELVSFRVLDNQTEYLVP